MLLLLTVSTRMIPRSIIPSRSPVHSACTFARSMVRVLPAFCGAGAAASAAFPNRTQEHVRLSTLVMRFGMRVVFMVGVILTVSLLLTPLQKYLLSTSLETS